MAKEEMNRFVPQNRDFLFSGDVTQQSIAQVTSGLLGVINHDIYLKQVFPLIHKSEYKPEPIRLYIDSYGGDAFACLGLISVIEASSTPIFSIVTGSAMSAGQLIACAAHKRFCYKRSTFMVHQLLTEEEGDLETLKQAIAESERIQARVENIIYSHTKITKKKMEQIKKNKIDWYIEAEEAVKVGLVDAILTSQEELFAHITK
jgi:ATP-dependent Clp protease protease subunit